jgi:hypothetical protein
MAASCWPSSIMRWLFTMGASALLPRVLFHCGSRLHHWLPTSPGCPCSLRDEVPSLYPTTGSAFPMDVGQSVAGCVVRSIRELGRFFEDLHRNRERRSSQNSSFTHFGGQRYEAAPGGSVRKRRWMFDRGYGPPWRKP